MSNFLGEGLCPAKIVRLASTVEGDWDGEPAEPRLAFGVPALARLVPPQEKACIAEAEKSVTLFHGSFVNFHGFIPSYKSRNKHNECAFWQMEVCYKAVNGFKFIARIDKNFCFLFHWHKFTVFAAAFKHPNACCSDCNNSSTLRFYLI